MGVEGAAPGRAGSIGRVLIVGNVALRVVIIRDFVLTERYSEDGTRLFANSINAGWQLSRFRGKVMPLVLLVHVINV